MNYYPMQNCKRGAMKGRSRKQKKEENKRLQTKMAISLVVYRLPVYPTETLL